MPAGMSLSPREKKIVQISDKSILVSDVYQLNNTFGDSCPFNREIFSMDVLNKVFHHGSLRGIFTVLAFLFTAS